MFKRLLPIACVFKAYLPRGGKVGAGPPILLLLEGGLSQIIEFYVLTRENGHVCDCFLDQSLFSGSCSPGAA